MTTAAAIRSLIEKSHVLKEEVKALEKSLDWDCKVSQGLREAWHCLDAGKGSLIDAEKIAESYEPSTPGDGEGKK